MRVVIALARRVVVAIPTECVLIASCAIRLGVWTTDYCILPYNLWDWILGRNSSSWLQIMYLKLILHACSGPSWMLVFLKLRTYWLMECSTNTFSSLVSCTNIKGGGILCCCFYFRSIPFMDTWYIHVLPWQLFLSARIMVDTKHYHKAPSWLYPTLSQHLQIVFGPCIHQYATPQVALHAIRQTSLQWAVRQRREAPPPSQLQASYVKLKKRTPASCCLRQPLLHYQFEVEYSLSRTWETISWL